MAAQQYHLYNTISNFAYPFQKQIFDNRSILDANIKTSLDLGIYIGLELKTQKYFHWILRTESTENKQNLERKWMVMDLGHMFPFIEKQIARIF